MPARKPAPITLAGSAGEQKPRRSKEEIAAEKAAKAQARLVRIEAMRAACLAECKVPCSMNCENRCHKRKIARLVSTAKRERLKAKARRMSGLSEQDLATPKSVASEGEARAASAARIEAKKEAHRRAQEEAAKAAQKAQRRGKKVDYSDLGKAIERPTVERLRHAGQFHGVGKERRMGEIVTSKGLAQVEVVNEHITCRDAPFDRLIARKILARDEDLNMAFNAAGYRYAQEVEKAGMDNLASVDPAGSSGKKSADGLVIRSNAQLDAFKDVLDLRSKLTADEQTVVDAVLLQRASITDAGRMISGRQVADVAAGIGVYVMQTALQVMARHYGYMPKTRYPLREAGDVSKRDLHLALAAGLSVEDASLVSRIIDDHVGG